MQEFLGHSSPETTQIYTLVIADQLRKIAVATSLSDQLTARRLRRFSEAMADIPQLAEIDMDVYTALRVLEAAMEKHAAA